MGKEAPNEYRQERDVDHYNQKLWKRKKYREQKDKDFRKKVYKQFKSHQNEDDADQAQVDSKSKQFYESLFKGEPEKKPERSKKQSHEAHGFNSQLNKIQNQKVSKEEERAKHLVKVAKDLKHRQRYSKQLQRKNAKGQPVMSAMLGHYLNKIQKSL